MIDVKQTVVRKAWSWNPVRNTWLIFQCGARFMLRGSWKLRSLPPVFTDEILERLLCRGEPQWQGAGWRPRALGHPGLRINQWKTDRSRWDLGSCVEDPE